MGDRWRLLQAFVALTIAIWIVGVSVQLRAPDFGYGDSARGDGTMLVTEVDPGGPAARAGLRVGDIVAADPGVPLHSPFTERELLARVRLLRSALLARRLPITVRQDGVERHVVVVPTGTTTTDATVRHLRRIAPLWLPLFAFFSMAILLARRPRSPRPEHELDARRRVAWGFGFIAPAFGFNWPQPGWPAWLQLLAGVVTNVGPLASMLLLASFAWTFPQRGSLARARWLHVAVPVLAAIAALNSVLEDCGLVRSPFRGNAAQLYVDCALLVLLIAGLVWQRRHARNAVERRQVDVVLGAFVFCLVAAASVASNAYGATGSVWRFQLTMASCVVIPIAFAVAVGRQGLFAFDAFAVRTLIYSMVTLVSLLTYLIVAEAIVQLSPGARGDFARWAALAIAIVIAAPVRAATERGWDRAFGRDSAALLARCFRLVGTLERASHQQAILGAVRDELQVERAEIVSAKLTRRVVEVVSLHDAQLADELLLRGYDVLIRLASDDAPCELALAISRPPTLGILGEAERIALESLGNAIGAWVRGHQTERELRSRVHDAETSRKRIAMDLHDGIGATLAAAKVMTQLLRCDATPRGSADPLSSLERTLAEGLDELRTTLASLEDESTSWDETIARLRRHLGDVCSGAGLELELRVSSGESAAPPAATRLAVLRMVQEALTNSVRHARARTVRCSIDSTDQAVLLRYEDDGVGLGSDRDHGRGLRNMIRRARELGGSLRFERPEAGGLRIVGALPSSARPEPHHGEVA